MIQIGNIPLSVGAGMEELRKKAAKALGVRPGTLGELTIVRQSIDARNKSEVHYVYTVETAMPGEKSLVVSAPGKNVKLV